MDILELVRAMDKKRKQIDTKLQTIERLTSIQLRGLPLGELK